MATQRSRRGFLATAGTVGLAGLAGCTGGEGVGDGEGGSSGTTGGGPSGRMTIFHAGSLAAPFEAAEAAFEEAYDVRVNREAKGSVGSTRKIIDQGRSADVLGVSDFRLIREMVRPEFADWYGIFTTNAMAIGYTAESTGADEFATGNWWEVLGRDGVRFAHSDPAVDPNGYRSVMAMKLGAIPFRGETLFDRATTEALIGKTRITSGTETDLIGQLQSGALDYAWEYQSAGASHDIQVIGLQPAVNLARATAEYAGHYAKATVRAGDTTYTGAPIAYGVTVPSVAQNPEAGAAWVEFMTTGPGKEILVEHGFSPVSPMVVPADAEDAVPPRVADGATFQSGLGPFEL